MKTCNLHFALLALAVTISSSSIHAQTTLPYYTGFDNTSQQTGWQEIRQGINSIEDWTIDTGGSSAPKMLWHDYPVGGTSIDTVMDWFVSPPFHFYGGGHIDSLKINLFCMNGTPTADDQFQIYLLQGAPDPGAATSVTLLADLTHMASTANTWRDTGNFIIPPTAGSSYIAFKYRATNDWFVPHIDDVYLTGDTAASVTGNSVPGNEIRLFPNPASQVVNLSLPDTKTRTLVLHNVFGSLVKKQVINSITASFDVSSLSKGAYYISILQDGEVAKTISWVKN